LSSKKPFKARRATNARNRDIQFRVDFDLWSSALWRDRVEIDVLSAVGFNSELQCNSERQHGRSRLYCKEYLMRRTKSQYFSRSVVGSFAVVEEDLVTTSFGGAPAHCVLHGPSGAAKPFLFSLPMAASPSQSATRIFCSPIAGRSSTLTRLLRTPRLAV
jgi:hypothetical protein